MPAMEAEQERHEEEEEEEEEVVKELGKLCIQEKQSGSGSVPDLHEVEKILGYGFKNRRLLEEAFTHASFPAGDGGGASYERLEYVGDAVLTLLFSKEHYFLYPDSAPGPLTQLRAANVDSEKLARAAVKHGLHRFLRHKKPFLEEKVSSKSLNFSTLSSPFLTKQILFLVSLMMLASCWINTTLARIQRVKLMVWRLTENIRD
jgi:dsRNA-specific ribonuclease